MPGIRVTTSIARGRAASDGSVITYRPCVRATPTFKPGVLEPLTEPVAQPPLEVEAVAALEAHLGVVREHDATGRDGGGRGRAHEREGIATRSAGRARAPYLRCARIRRT